MNETIIITTKEALAVVLQEVMPKAQALPPEVVELERLKRKEMLTTTEVSILYNLNANTLRKRRVSGDGPAYCKDGSNVFYTHTAIKKYLETHRTKTYDQP